MRWLDGEQLAVPAHSLQTCKCVHCNGCTTVSITAAPFTHASWCAGSHECT